MRRTQNEDEARLVRLLAAGDHGAFAEVYRKYNAPMMRVAGAILRNRASAEEVAQDAWVSVLRNIESFEGRSSLATWIFTILANAARNRARRDGRNVSFNDDGGSDGLADAFDGTGHWARLPALWDDITPERIVAGRRLLDRVKDAIDELPETQRAVVTLRMQDELEPAEVCEILQISESNMRVLLHRGRVAIRNRLTEVLG